MLTARPVRGLWRMSIALRILPSPYPLQHWPVLGGSASPFEADDGLLPAGRYDTDPISRRERGRRKSLRATTLARDGGSGGNGIGNANWLSRHVRCRRHRLFSCQGAVQRARAMAGGIRSCACMRGRTLATASQVSTSPVARGLRVFAVVSPWPRRAATAPCPIRVCRTAGRDRLKLAVPIGGSIAHVCEAVTWRRGKGALEGA